MKGFFSSVANWFTLSRAICVPVLWFLALEKMPVLFGFVFAWAGVSDALDGFFARKLHQASKFGSWFDSFADNLVSVSVIFWFWLLIPEFVHTHLTVVLLVFFIFILNLLISFCKFKRMPVYHAYSSKVAAVLLYIFGVHAILFVPSGFLFAITIVAILFNQFEEIIFSLKSKHLNSRLRSLFE